MQGLTRWFRTGVLRCTAVLCVVLLSGCSTVRPWQNQPLTQLDRPKAAFEAPEVDDRSLLLIVSLSGGGARAAAFGYGVLDALRQTPVTWKNQQTNLLHQVDVISGVSGGSIIASYYAAFGAHTFPAFEQQFLRQSFQDNLINTMLKPGTLHNLTSPWFGRSNLLERRLDELYKGKTFGDLGNQPGQPRLLVSATDLSLGSTFEFTWRQFSLICSDLNSVPLSFAVAASSAVPLALSPMTLKNYSDECSQDINLRRPQGADYRSRILHENQLSYREAKARPYIHLVDGGVADNLGLRSMLDRSQADGGLRSSVRLESATKIQKLVIIAVNAERDPTENIDASDTVPSLLQVVDTLLFGSGARATQETLGLLADTAQVWRSELRRKNADDDPFTPDAKIHVINVNLRDAPDLVRRRALLQVPTSFSIPPKDVDQLIEAGRGVLRASPEFKKLMDSLAGGKIEP